MSGVKSKNFVLLSYIMLSIALAFFALNTFVKFLGIEAFKKGDYQRARKYFSLLIPKDRKMIGITYYKDKLFEEAFNYYKKANDEKGMGLAYLGLKNYDKAIEYFEKTKSYSNKGFALLGQKKYKEALELFEKAEDNSGLGLAYLSMGDLDKAEEAFRNSSDNFGLGVVLYSKGQHFAAMKAFKKSPNNTAKGMSYFIKGDLKKAKKYFSKKADLTIQGFFDFLIGNYDKAEEIYIYSKDDKKQGLLFMKIGQLGQAYEKFTSLSDYENLGELFYRVKDYERSFEYFKKAGKDKKAFDALMARQDVDRAITFAKNILQREINYPKLRLSISEIYRKEGKFDFALQELDKVSKNNAYEDIAFLYKARTYFYNKDYKSASNEIDKLKGLYNDKTWFKSIALSSKNLNELSGKKVVDVEQKIEKDEEEDDDSFEDEEEGSSILKWILIMLGIGALGGAIYFVYTHIDKKAAVDQRKSILGNSNKLGAKGKIEEVVNVQQVLKLDDFKFDGINVLLSVLKKQGIKTMRDEIVELSGEGENKLSVYGIYLASRAKNVAVKGIKIDWSYLNDVKTSVIVFFKDETFANLMAIKDKKVSLDFGMDKLVTISVDDFLLVWNEYVMIFGAS